MLLTCAQFWLGARADLFDSRLLRHCVLHSSLNARNTTNRVRMPLANALAPECISLAFRQNRFAKQTVQREQAWIPANGNQCHIPALCRCLIDCSKVLRNTRMRIKAVYRCEQASHCRPLLRQIAFGATAQNQDVYAV